ncbi:MAG: hypothetical protein U0746_12645 [Gemmataceae bacterium]
MKVPFARSRLSLIGQTRQRVKDLRGFRKTHHVPDRIDSASISFLNELAVTELKADLDATFAAVRTAFGYTRRRIKVAFEDGLAALRTPEFDYTVTSLLAADDASIAILRREASRLKSPALLTDPRFRTAFANSFQTLAIEFRKPTDVSRVIDRIEALNHSGLILRYPADAAWCELDIVGFAGIVRIEATRCEIRSRGVLSKRGLFEAYDAFVALFAQSNLPMLS